MLLERLYKISAKKYLHLIIGIVLSQLIVAGVVTIGLTKILGLITSFILSTGIMFCKEYFWNKKLEKGQYDIKNFWAAFIGIFYGILIFIF